jgi:hypothetical protein
MHRIFLFALALAAVLSLAIAAPPQRALCPHDDAPPDPPRHIPLITDEGCRVYRCCEATSTRGTLCRIQQRRRGSEGCIRLPCGEIVGPYRLSELVLETPRAPRAPLSTSASPRSPRAPLSTAASPVVRRQPTSVSPMRVCRGATTPLTDDGRPATPSDPSAPSDLPVDPPAPSDVSRGSPVAPPAASDLPVDPALPPAG